MGDAHLNPLRDRRFAAYFAGDAVSQLGDRVSELAIPLIAITMLQADAVTVGLLTAALWAPNLLSLLVGTWVDARTSKKRLLVAANLVQAAAIVSLPLAYVFAGITLAQLVVVALLTGLAGVLAHTAWSPFFTRLVRQEDYVAAGSLLSGTRSASTIIGLPLGGVLIQVATAPVAMIIDAVSFVVSAVVIGSLRVDEVPPHPQEPFRRRIAEGLTYVFRHAYLRAALGCVTTANLFSFMIMAIQVLYASRILGLTPAEIGLAFGIGAVGGLSGAVVAGPLARRIRTGPTIVLGAVTAAAPFVLLPLAAGADTGRLAWLAAVSFATSAGIMIFDINLNAVLFAVTPDPVRSRVVGTFGTINYGIRPAGAVLGGLLAGTVGIAPTMIIAAVGGCSAIIWLITSPIIRIRRVDDLSPV